MTISRLRLRAPAWLHWPRRTARLRFTALYGGLFLFSGAALVAITYVLFERATRYTKPQLPQIPRTRPRSRNSRYLSYQMPWRSSSTTRVSCHRPSIS